MGKGFPRRQGGRFPPFHAGPAPPSARGAFRFLRGITLHRGIIPSDADFATQFVSGAILRPPSAMIGLGVLVALGRRLLAATVAETGLLPARYYRHLVLAALEEEDFPGALKWLPYAGDKLLAQLIIFRLRLLLQKHEDQRQALADLLQKEPPPDLRSRLEALMAAENQALELLQKYHAESLRIMRGLQGGPGAGP